MKRPPEFDVIVVGGGPAGSSCAMMLARDGVRVLLLEKSRFPRDKICGDCVNPRIWGLFETLGVAGEIRQQMHTPISSVTIRIGNGRCREIPVPAGRGGPFIAISRSVLDDILLRRAAADGVEVLHEMRITDIQRGDRWGVKARSCAGDATRYTCSELVGADGRNSVVARWVAQPQPTPVRGAEASGRVGIQWETDRQDAIGNSLEMVLFDCGYGGVVNLGDESANVAMVVEPGVAQLAFSDFHGFLSRTLWNPGDGRARFPNVMPRGELRASSPIGPRHALRRSPHARCIGDARSLVEPLSGLGVLFAVHDGVSAAWDVLKQRGITPSFPRPSPPGRFLAGRVFPSLLRDMKRANRILAMALCYSPVISWVARRIL